MSVDTWQFIKQWVSGYKREVEVTLTFDYIYITFTQLGVSLSQKILNWEIQCAQVDICLFAVMVLAAKFQELADLDINKH